MVMDTQFGTDSIMPRGEVTLTEIFSMCCLGSPPMDLFRQQILPFLILLVFLLALGIVSARIFLPTDMLAPAPIGFLG